MPPIPPLDPSDERLEAIFHGALGLSDLEERDAFVATECKDDIALELRVRRLLGAHDESALMWPQSKLPPAIEADLARLKPEQEGDRIGNYTLREQIGEGGFGTVWVADQETPIQRRVALKIIKLGMDTKEVIARFEQERQVLALMDHQNIAKVFDAGATQYGRPFFVMELIRGIKITDYCDQAKLSTTERLGLFVQVCLAVQHAHQKGIIHRDLKPSNVLVTLHDGVPVPKIIDFGVAKAMQQRLTDLTIYTRFEQMLGTPLYMSPEQTEMSGLNVDTRSDIYSLGVLLYELLVGVTPFDPKELLEAGHEAIRRVIREKEPPKPSTALRTMVAELRTNIAQHRHTDPSRMVGILLGDLDWIIMKALEKDRTRRYDTANSFAEDIQRHLKSEPVVARPPSTAYVLRKLILRHRIAFGAGSAVVLALFTGIIVSSWQAVLATRAKDVAATQSRKARTAELEAEQQRMMAENNLYTANMSLVQVAWDQGNVGRVRELLNATRSYPFRGFEWFYWQQQIHLELHTLRGHSSRLMWAGFSPDGRKVVTKSIDRICKVWDVATGRELLAFKERDYGKKTNFPNWRCPTPVFSPDSKRILTASIDHTVEVWDVATGRELHALVGHAKMITAMAYSPDGRRIVTGSSDHSAKVWDADTGNELQSLEGHTQWPNAVAFSPDGKRIVTGGEDCKIKVWDTDSGRELFDLKGCTSPIRFVGFTPDGLRVLTLSKAISNINQGVDTFVRSWDVKTGRELLIHDWHTNKYEAVSFLPDGRHFVMGSQDGTVTVWDAETNRESLTFKTKSGLAFSVFDCSPDNHWIASTSGTTVLVWEIETGRERLTLKGHESGLTTVAFSPDGKEILTGSYDKTAKLWDVRIEPDSPANWKTFGTVAISPDGRKAISGYDPAKLWDVQTSSELATFRGNFQDVVFSHDGRRIITANGDNTAKVWDVETGKDLLTLKNEVGFLSSVAISSDGLRLMTGSIDHTVKLWDADSGTELLSFKSAGVPMAFSPDGKRVLTGSDDRSSEEPFEEGGIAKPGADNPVNSPDAEYTLSSDGPGSDGRGNTAKVWDTETGRELHTLIGHTSKIFSLAYSPDGRRIITGSRDNTAKVWDAATGRNLFSLNGHTAEIISIAISLDGRRILTGSADRTAKLWDMETGNELLTLKGNHDNHATFGKVAFSPDGRRILTGSSNRPATVWVAASSEEVQAWIKEEQDGQQPSR